LEVEVDMSMIVSIVAAVATMLILFAVGKWVNTPLEAGGLFLTLSPLVDGIAHKDFDTGQTYLVLIGIIMLGVSVVLGRRGARSSRG
jgi:hypothetical protein